MLMFGEWLGIMRNEWFWRFRLSLPLESTSRQAKYTRVL
jgi:hypothetical protein